MKKAELKQLLQAASEKQMSRAASLAGNDNPQVVAIKTEHLAAYKTLNAVLEALDSPRPLAAYQLQILTR